MIRIAVRIVYLFVLVFGVIVTRAKNQPQFEAVDLKSLAQENQFLGITQGDADHKVHIGGGNSVGNDPTVYVEGGAYGADYFYAVITLTDNDWNVLDKVNYRFFIKPGNIVEAWYVDNIESVSYKPLSPKGKVPAYYWNKDTGLAIAIYGINVPLVVMLSD